LDAGDIDGWANAMPAEFRAAERLRSHLLNHPVVVTDDPVVKKLLADIDLTELDDADKMGMQLLWGSIGPAEYATNLALVDILVAPFQIPVDLQQFLREARECYAIGHHAAVQSLSRTILEAAVNDIAVRSGKMSKEVIERDMFKKYPPWRRIQLVSGALFNQINDHYRDLCKVVHGLTTSASSGSLGSLTKTIGFVQLLYERNKAEIHHEQNA
jgi:hypothetical protein